MLFTVMSLFKKKLSSFLDLFQHNYIKSKGKVIPLQARCGPEGG